MGAYVFSLYVYTYVLNVRVSQHLKRHKYFLSESIHGGDVGGARQHFLVPVLW